MSGQVIDEAETIVNRPDFFLAIEDMAGSSHPSLCETTKFQWKILAVCLTWEWRAQGPKGR